MSTIAEQVALIDLVDRLLGGGVVIYGDITLAAARRRPGLCRAEGARLLGGDRAGEGTAPGSRGRAVIELYAITDHPGPPLPEVGALQVVWSGDLAAVCGQATDGELTAELLWQRERVVESLMEDRDLLPVRYGTRVRDEDAAVKALEADHDRLVEALARVRGAVEISVRVFDADPDPAPTPEKPSTGAAYLRAKAGQLSVRDEARQVVHEPLSAVSRAQTARPTSLAGELLHAAYLVNHDEVGRFSSVVERLQSTTNHGG